MSSLFIKEHVCNSDSVCYFLDNGEVVYRRQVLCTTEEATLELLEKVASDKDTCLVGGSVCCSICEELEIRKINKSKSN